MEISLSGAMYQAMAASAILTLLAGRAEILYDISHVGHDSSIARSSGGVSAPPRRW
ncbi:MAG: hypothetical protein OEZ32_05200 [Nitrospinota bacterium]|nr:hypothetical protein [Nitrospinota bacterium]